ncbi:unnamed protein product [Phytophthora fragariaefolia]|uniref:Unnamed protein product n=1 Tax=Phytophthora fragariaefolia TaxID=1490495 RepID=A0A9W6Y538_9STRA|nr:unnamed protein product [Phytophthora fragariaefolia]
MMRRRRQAQTEDAVADSNVDDMLSAGVIEHGEGAWGFPVVLVRKKDGSVRFCVDYRALNSITRKDVYPLPRIDETLESLGGARLFTTLDLRSGYWQIRVAKEDRDKTAFMTKRGLYRFMRMPFGLTNAPATFQRLMNGVLRGLAWLTCLVYLDDIIIFTKGGIERHVVELAGVLQRLRSAGLSLKLKKCTFATTSMEYLGHHLSDRGVQPAERLVKSVKEFPRPVDAVEVKRFVHLAGYYRKFIAAFGSIVEPLTRLLKKDVKWQWSEAQEFAFERVKMLLTTRPLLLYPNFELPFRLVTDASKMGLGACLMQDQGHGWQPIAYGSKVNSTAESNYSITELECLAGVWSVKMFRPYLYGRAFTIITDHSALKWLMTRPILAGRLQRWSLVLREYEFQVEYRPGATNVVADALSRAPAAVRAAVGRRRRRQPEVVSASDVASTGEVPPTARETHVATTGTIMRGVNDMRVATPSDNLHTTTAGDGQDAAASMVMTATLAPDATTAGETTVRTTPVGIEMRATVASTTTNDHAERTEATRVEDEDGGAMAAESASNGAAPNQFLTGKTTTTPNNYETDADNATVANDTATRTLRHGEDEELVTPNDGRDGASTPPTDELLRHDDDENDAATNATAVNEIAGAAMMMTPVPITTKRKRAKRTVVPATRRSARLREQAERHVHWAATVPDMNDTAPTTTTLPVSTDAPHGVREATTMVEPRMTTMTTTAAGASDVNDTAPTRESPMVTTTVTLPVSTNAPHGAREAMTEPAMTRTTQKVAPWTRTATHRSDDAPTTNSKAEHGNGRNVAKAPTRTKCAARTKTTTVRREAPTGQRRITASTRTTEAGVSTPMTVTTLPTTKATTRKDANDKRATNDTTAATANATTRKNVTDRSALMADDANDMGDDANTNTVDDYTLQLSDDEIMTAQKHSKFVKKLQGAGKYGSMNVVSKYGLVTIETTKGWRVILPPTLWATVFKEMHGSVWSGHLRGPHTYGRVAQLYWWPGLYREVRKLIRGCQECGSRKTKPREVIPPLRSLRGGAVGDRWALDVAGPFPIADGGDRYVIAAVKYVTRYAVASCVTQHTAESVATFLMQEVVLSFGVFRELLTDGAPELAGKVIEELVQTLQAHQVNPVPYRPQLVGLVERFHRSWKDCVATFMQDERQTDWNLWVKFAVYSYNSAKHSTVALSPNELMMGRRLRAPNELLRRTEVTEAGELSAYHANLIEAMKRSHECAEQARKREQERQARYYNRRVKNRREFRPGDLVWMHNPPRGKNATKVVHQWMGPLHIIEPAGYDNFALAREHKTGKKETIIAHVSYLINYHYPTPLLAQSGARHRLAD